MAHTPIEYIESTGTQYIDTLFTPNSNTSIEIGMIISDPVQYGTFFGTDNHLKLQQFAENAGVYNYYYGNQELRFEIDFLSNDVNIIYCNKTKIYVNSELIDELTNVEFTANSSLLLFCGKYEGIIETYCIPSIKLFHAKIWDNETLLYDLIPVLDENNEACLYNKVTGTYLYNVGEGDFIAGNVVSNPIITIGTPTRTKISHISGCDQATVTFQSDMELSEWEARATYEGQTPGHGVGLLVESGGSLEANTEATVYIDDEELTSGDREYTISIFGLSTEGRWSDG